MGMRLMKIVKKNDYKMYQRLFDIKTMHVDS